MTEKKAEPLHISGYTYIDYQACGLIRLSDDWEYSIDDLEKKSNGQPAYFLYKNEIYYVKKKLLQELEITDDNKRNSVEKLFPKVVDQLKFASV